MLEGYRKRQWSQWEMPPEEALVVCRWVNTSLSSALCKFSFYDKNNNALVTNDADKELQAALIEAEPNL